MMTVVKRFCRHGILLFGSYLACTFAEARPTQSKYNAAVERVKTIVNQPAQSYPRDPKARVAMYSPGWFHEGAIKPDFNNVEIRKSQEALMLNTATSLRI